MSRSIRLVLSLLCVIAVLLPGAPLTPDTVFAQRAKIEPADVALRPSDLVAGFTVTKEDAKPMSGGPGVIYSKLMERPITNETMANGPIGVMQLIGRFDSPVSYEGFLDEIRKKSIESDGFEQAPGAPNDGGTSSLQKFDGDAAMFEVGFIKNDMVIFTRWIGHRTVVSLQGVLTLAGVSSARYDQLLAGGSPAPPADPAASAPPPPPAASSAPSGPSASAPGTTTPGRIGNTGGSGANLRANPSSNGELLRVLAEGEEVTLIGVEEPGADGRKWRNVKTKDGTVGWVVAEYVLPDGQPAVASAPPAPTSTPTPVPAPPPPPPTSTPARATPTPTPARQEAPSRPAGAIDSRLQPALRLLYAIKNKLRSGATLGDLYRRIVTDSGVSMAVEGMPSTVNGAFVARDNAITLNSQMLSEDSRVVAATLAHELTHVAQILIGDNPNRGCVDKEVEAHRQQIITWDILFDGYAPGRTQRERNGNFKLQMYVAEGDPWLYRYVVDSEGYQDQCRLWVP